MSKKVLMIVNPRAGRMRIRNALYGAIEKLCAADYIPTVVMTQYSGHASKLAMEAADYDLVVCTGGDGTLNQVVNGLIISGIRKPLGYIPLGSTNDFAGSMKIPNNVEKALDIVIDGNSHPIDVARINNCYFLDTAFFGAFSRASYETSQDMKNALGFVAYILEGIKDIPSIRTYDMAVSIDDKEIRGEFMLCAVSNSNTLGGFIPLDRSIVSVSDGKFEIILAVKPQSAMELRDMIRALRTGDTSCNGIVFCSGAKINIKCDSSEPWTVDGEKLVWDGVANIEVIPNAIELMLPIPEEQSDLTII